MLDGLERTLDGIVEAPCEVGIYAETLASLPEGSFSPRIFALEKRIYNHG